MVLIFALYTSFHFNEVSEEILALLDYIKVGEYEDKLKQQFSLI